MARCWMVVGVMLVGMLMIAGNGGQVDGAVDCNKVTANIAGCLGYIKFKGAQPTRNSVCCNGVRAIDGTAITQPIRREICTCLQKAATTIKPDATPVGKLASICGAKHAFSLNQNCAQVP